MKFFFVFTIFLYALNQAYSQDLPGKRDSIFSEVLKEKRIVQVLLPKDYKPGSSSKYDVIYLLDGKDNITLFSQIQQFLEKENYVPPVILVGVFSTKRVRDLTHVPMKTQAGSGGSANFLTFFKEELIPYINKSYPSNGENILWGHSLAGLFCMYTLLTEPKLFSAYMAADPSFWWADNHLSKVAAEKLISLSGLDRILFISGRGDDLEDMGIPQMDSVLNNKRIKGLYYTLSVYEDETHMSVRLKSIYDGLKKVYKGHSTRDQIIEFHPMNGIVLNDTPYQIYSSSHFPETRYTLNGMAPGSASAKLENANTFTGPIKLSVKSFSPQGRYDKSASGNFTLGKEWDPVRRPENIWPGGLSYKYFEGDWDKVPEFKNLKPLQSGIANTEFTFRKLSSKIHFACSFEGLIEIQEDGYYTFVLDIDDGAKFYLKNKLLINYDGVHIIPELQSFLVPLQKGFYPLRLEYFQKDKGADLRLMYIPPGKKEPMDVPYELLYSAK